MTGIPSSETIQHLSLSLCLCLCLRLILIDWGMSITDKRWSDLRVRLDFRLQMNVHATWFSSFRLHLNFSFSLLSKTAFTWQFVIYWDIFRERQDLSVKPTQGRLTFSGWNDYLLISIGFPSVIWCAKSGHSSRGYFSSDKMMAGSCCDRVISSILSNNDR
jgi:hypothetical protein